MVAWCFLFLLGVRKATGSIISHTFCDIILCYLDRLLCVEFSLDCLSVSSAISVSQYLLIVHNYIFLTLVRLFCVLLRVASRRNSYIASLYSVQDVGCRFSLLYTLIVSE